MEWISVKKQLPPEGIPIRIKAQYHDDISVEAECIFSRCDIDEYTEAWKWTMNIENCEKYGTIRLTHWMPLPQPPKENE